MLTHFSMSKGNLSKKERDENFEEFLKEDCSTNDSMEKYFESSVKKRDKPSKNGSAEPWWMKNDETSESSEFQGLGSGKSFMKKPAAPKIEEKKAQQRRPTENGPLKHPQPLEVAVDNEPDERDHWASGSAGGGKRPTPDGGLEDVDETVDGDYTTSASHAHSRQFNGAAGREESDLHLALTTTNSSGQNYTETGIDEVDGHMASNDHLNHRAVNAVGNQQHQQHHNSSEMLGTLVGYNSALNTMSSSGVVVDQGQTRVLSDQRHQEPPSLYQPSYTNDRAGSPPRQTINDKEGLRSARSESEIWDSANPMRGNTREEPGMGPSMLSKVSLHDSCEDTTTAGGLGGGGGHYRDIKGGDGNVHVLGTQQHPHLVSSSSGTAGGFIPGGLDSNHQITLGAGGDTTAADLSAIHANYAALGATGLTLASSGPDDKLQDDLVFAVEGRTARAASTLVISQADPASSILTTHSFGLRPVGLAGRDLLDSPPPVPTPRQQTKSSLPHKADQAAARFTNIQSSGYGRQSVSSPPPASSASVRSLVNGNTRTGSKGRIAAAGQGGSGSGVNSWERKATMSSGGGGGIVKKIARPLSGPQSRERSTTGGGVGGSQHRPQSRGDGRSSSGTVGSREKAPSAGGDTSRLVSEVKEWQDQWKEERKQVSKMKADFLLQEREHKKELDLVKMEQDQKVYRLESEVSRLQARLDDKVSLVDRKLPSDVSKEDIVRLEKEMGQQENLLVGYQRENERLYSQMKKLEATNKQSEGHLLQENQRLHQEVATLRAELDVSQLQVRSRVPVTSGVLFGSHTGGGPPADGSHASVVRQHLESDLRTVRHELDIALKKMRDLEVDKQKAEAIVDRLTSDKATVATREQREREVNSVEVEKLREEHQEVVAGLKKKLRWYVENQALLNKDAVKIKEKDRQIAVLESKLERALPANISSSVRSKERLADARKIQMLESQTGELQSQKVSGVGGGAKKGVDNYLEVRIQDLETQLAERDTDDDKALRTLRQQYYAMKAKYEDQIQVLESELSGQSPESESRLVTLRREVDSLQQTLKERDMLVERLKREIKTAGRAAPLSSTYSAAGRGRAKPGDNRSDTHVKELLQRDEEIRRLNNLLGEKSRRPVRPSTSTGVKTSATAKDPAFFEDEGRFSRTFMGDHPADVLAENERLKHEILECRAEADRYRALSESASAQRVSLQAGAQSQADDRLRKERQTHKEELQRVKLDFAQSHAQTRVAELQAKSNTQEVVIQHLKEQLAQNAVDTRALEASRKVEAEARQEVERLRRDLAEARANHTPQMRHFDQLKAKVVALEDRQIQRDAGLEQYVEKRVTQSKTEAEREAARWRRLVDEKNKSLSIVGAELDRLLEALEELQRQGVVLPVRLNRLSSIQRKLNPAPSED